MQKAVQEALKLTAKCDVELWKSLEKPLASAAASLPKKDFIDVCLHYGDHEKGSSEFWTSMSKVVTKNFKSYSAGEIVNLFDAFAYAGTQYKFPKEFTQNMVSGIKFAASKVGDALDKRDPRFNPSVKEALKVKYAEWLKKGPNPFLEFTDDLKIEAMPEGKAKEKAKTISDIAKEWQKVLLKF